MVKYAILFIAFVLGGLSVVSPVVSVVFFVVLMLGASLFLHPQASFYIASALLPISNFGLEIDKTRLSVYYGGIIIAFFVWLVHKGAGLGKARRDTQALMAFGVIFVAWSFIALAWTPNKSSGFLIFCELFSALVIFLMIPDLVRTQVDLRRYFGFLSIVAVALGAITFTSQFYDGSETLELMGTWYLYAILLSEKGRAAGFTGVNYAATILDFLVFVIMSYHFLSGGRFKYLTIPATFFIFVAIVLTGSKSGFGGLIIGLIIINLLLPGRGLKYIALSAFMFFGAFVTAALSTTGDVTSTRVTAVGASFSFETRFTWWGKGFRALVEHYGLGLGTGGFREIIYPVQFAHNIFLSTLFDLGIIGFTFFFLILVYTYVIFWRGYKASFTDAQKSVVICMMASFTGYLLNNLLQGDYYNRIFWLMLGIYVATTQVIASAGEEKAKAPLPASDPLPKAPMSAGARKTT